MISVGSGIFIRLSSKIVANRGTTKFRMTKIDPGPDAGEQRGVNHRRNNVASQLIARPLEFGQAFENLPEAARSFSRPHHVDVKIGVVSRMQRQRVGQRFAAFNGPQNIEYHGPKLRPRR